MSQWKDIDIELSQQQDGDIKAMTDIDAINNSLRNIFMTFKGSRRMLPEAFADMYHLLFEPMDDNTSYRLGELLVEAIEEWETRIEIINLNVNINEDMNQYEIRLTYKIKDSDLEYQFDHIILSLA